LTNIDILELTQLPEHLMIIGGSYIGLEFGQMFRRFGSKVTIIERGDRLIVRKTTISDAVADIMKSEAVELKFNAKEINVSQDGNGISIKINGVDKEIKGSLTTRCRADPNTDMLENTSINFDERDILPWMTIVKLA
jgi:pyruvate/2-oxoglutarate dehydrogenase complex dihydrolipoamide dehydrogenase (E3) component